MATIKEAFLALANYPKQEEIAGLRAGNAMIFLEAAAEARCERTSALCPRTHAQPSDLLMGLPTLKARLPFYAIGKHGQSISG